MTSTYSEKATRICDNNSENYGMYTELDGTNILRMNEILNK